MSQINPSTEITESVTSSNSDPIQQEDQSELTISESPNQGFCQNDEKHENSHEDCSCCESHDHHPSIDDSISTVNSLYESLDPDSKYTRSFSNTQPKRDFLHDKISSYLDTIKFIERYIRLFGSLYPDNKYEPILRETVTCLADMNSIVENPAILSRADEERKKGLKALYLLQYVDNILMNSKVELSANEVVKLLGFCFPEEIVYLRFESDIESLVHVSLNQGTDARNNVKDDLKSLKERASLVGDAFFIKSLSSLENKIESEFEIPKTFKFKPFRSTILKRLSEVERNKFDIFTTSLWIFNNQSRIDRLNKLFEIQTIDSFVVQTFIPITLERFMKRLINCEALQSLGPLFTGSNHKNSSSKSETSSDSFFNRLVKIFENLQKGSTTFCDVYAISAEYAIDDLVDEVNLIHKLKKILKNKEFDNPDGYILASILYKIIITLMGDNENIIEVINLYSSCFHQYLTTLTRNLEKETGQRMMDVKEHMNKTFNGPLEKLGYIKRFCVSFKINIKGYTVKELSLQKTTTQEGEGKNSKQ